MNAKLFKLFLIILLLVAVVLAVFWVAETAAKAASAKASASQGGNYLWQSLEAGDLAGMENQSQYAGYRFTPRRDVAAIELCGYFKGKYSVGLYDESFKMLASAPIAAYEQWNCAAIDPIALAKGKKYYVAVLISAGPAYYRFGNAILPRQNSDAVIESGVVQGADQEFGKTIETSASRVFGLADVKIISGDMTQARAGRLSADIATALLGWSHWSPVAVAYAASYGSIGELCAAECAGSSEEEEEDCCGEAVAAYIAGFEGQMAAAFKAGQVDLSAIIKAFADFINSPATQQYLNSHTQIAQRLQSAFQNALNQAANAPQYAGLKSNFDADKAAKAAASLNKGALSGSDVTKAVSAYMVDHYGSVPTFSQLAAYINATAGSTLIDTASFTSSKVSAINSIISIASAFSATAVDKTGAPKTVAGNPETAASTRASSLTTGWGQKMNAPVAVDKNGNPIYVKINVGTGLSAGSSFKVPLYTMDAKGNIISRGTTTYSVENSVVVPNYSAQAAAINANLGNIYVPVRAATSAFGLLNSQTALTFTNYGSQAGSPSPGQVWTAIPSGSTVLDSGAASVAVASETATAVAVSSVGNSQGVSSGGIEWLDTGATNPGASGQTFGDMTYTGSANALNQVYSGSLSYPTAAAASSGVTATPVSGSFSTGSAPSKNALEAAEAQGSSAAAWLAQPVSNLSLSSVSPSVTDKPDYSADVTQNPVSAVGQSNAADSGKELSGSQASEAANVATKEQSIQNIYDDIMSDILNGGYIKLDDVECVWGDNGPSCMIDQANIIATILEHIKFGWNNLLGSQVVRAAADEAADILANAAPPAISAIKASVDGSAVTISAYVKSQAAIGGVEARVYGKDGRFAAALALDNGGAGDNWSYVWQDTAGIAAGDYSVDIFAEDAGGNFVIKESATNFSLAAAQNVDCQDLKISGAANEKIDVVFVPCGYGNDLKTFEADARRQMEAILKIAPIGQSVDKFNFRTLNSTGLDCAVDLQDNMDKDANNFARAARQCLPDAVLALKKNSPAAAKGISLAGSGIGFVAADAPFAAVHELGHAIFYLNDEYSYGCTLADVSNSANCDSSPKCEKWKGLAGAGCYAGCSCGGNYRSSNDSVMLNPEAATQFSPAAARQVSQILSLFD